MPPDQSQDDLENLQAQYAQISIALEESLYVASSHRRGPSPAFSSHRVASPPGAAPLGPYSSSLRGSRRLDRPRSPSHDRSRSKDAFSGHPRPSRRSHERYEERAVPSDAPAHRRRPRDRYSPSRRHLDFPSKSPSPRQKRFASQGSPSSSRERFASRGSSSPKRMRVAPDVPFQERFASRRSPSSPQERFASRRSPASSQERFASRRSPSSPQRRFASKGSSSPKRMGFTPDAGPSSSRRPLSRESRSPRPHSSRDTFSPKRGSPSPKRRRYESRDSVSPHQHHSSRASSREPSQGRPHSRSSPNHPSSPSWEEKEADETSVPPTVKAMVDFIMKSFPEATASPAHSSSRSFDLSASVGATDVATPSGSLLAWCQVMADSFTATQKRFSQRIQEGRACHSLLPALHRFERVSNSPTQGKELKANPDILDLLRNKVPDFRQLPISIKEGISIERSLRSMMETHSFLTWSVMGLIKSFYEKKLLPKDDPVISQLQKSFSKACSSMASGLASNTAFMTMKRRQLLLSHVVPSVSEAQKRNLLSNPFFQTGSLFDTSSVESARSAARDLSLFKPHLKASSSSSQSSLDVDVLLARQPRGALLGSHLGLRHHSVLLPLSDSSLVGRVIHASIRSLPEPPETRGFSEVGVLSPHGGRRLPSQLLVGLEGSGGGRLGSRGTAGWLSDPPRPSTSSIRASALPAGVLPSVHQGSRLNPGASKPSSEGGSRASPTVSGFLQPSIPRPKGFGVVAPHHRSVDPERLHHLGTLPHGDSSVSPEFHPPRRLDDLPGLQDAYLQVPVHHDSRRFLRFVVAGKTYQFRVLCFGLTTAHQVFTRIMAPVSAILHRHGVRMLCYLDDWLILASTEIACIQSRDRLLAVCKELGIQVNFKKSSLVPSQSLVYLGMEIQSLPFIARPTPARANNLVRLIEEFLSTPSPPAFLWRRLLGHLSSLILFVSGGMIRMRLLQLCLKDQWDFLDDQFQVSWSPLC